MARRSNAKDRLFAQNLAKGMHQLDAYHKAGFKGSTNNAGVKARTPQIQAMVTEILDKVEAAVSIDKKWVIDQLVDVHNEAKTDRDHGARNYSLNLIGKELGMFIDRKDVRIQGKFEKMPDVQLLEHLKTVTEQLAITDQSE